MPRAKRTKKRRTQKEVLGPGITEIADVAEDLVEHVTHDAERIVRPISKRYPTLFLLLVTFGFVATLYGFERVIGDVPYIGDRPFLILCIGVVVLVATGTLYRKLK